MTNNNHIPVEMDESSRWIERIQSIVAGAYGITVPEIRRKSRQPAFALPRSVAIYFCKLRGFSYGHIARMFGFTSHASAINACRAVDQMVGANEKFSKRISELKERINKCE